MLLLSLPYFMISVIGRRNSLGFCNQVSRVLRCRRNLEYFPVQCCEIEGIMSIQVLWIIFYLGHWKKLAFFLTFTLLTSLIYSSKIFRSAYTTVIKRMHFLQWNSFHKFSVITLVAAAQVAQVPVLLQLAASLSFKFILYHFWCFCMLLCFSISYNFKQC